MRRRQKIAGIGVLLAVLLVLFAALWQWNWLREPIGKYVTEKTGRRFAINGDLTVHLGRTLEITLNDVRFDNAEWSDTQPMAQVDTLFLAVRVAPLFAGRFHIAELGFNGGEVSLERTADGKRNWTLAKSDDKSAEPPKIEQVSIQNSSIRYRDAPYEVDLTAKVSTDPTANPALPTHVDFSGTYKKVSFKGNALAGPVLTLEDSEAAFPAKVEARFGTTTAKLDGTLANINRGGVIDADLSVSGSNLAKVYPVLPVVLPDTAPFRIRGRFKRDGGHFRYDDFKGVIGASDINGSASYDKKQPRPLLKATLESKVLDLADLGPLIGMTPRQMAEVKSSPTKVKGEKKPADRSGPAPRVLPAKPFNLERMNAMDADVTLHAKQIRRPNEIPLDDMRTHIVLNGGELTLDPLEFGFSGGRIVAKVKLDGRSKPFLADTEINMRNVKLEELFPTFELMRASFGTIGAQIKLRGRGDSVATILGNANGEAGFAMAGGELSGLLLEAVDLNGAGIVKYLAFGDQNLPNRCSLAAFDVKDGVATARTLVFDTAISNIQGSGKLDLKQEEVDIKLNPRPKNKSVFVARTPILLHGPFSRLDWSLDKGPLAARGGAALALGAINPVAALLALLETGPGKDADCDALLAEVSGAQAQAHKSAKPSALPKPDKNKEELPAKRKSSIPFSGER